VRKVGALSFLLASLVFLGAGARGVLAQGSPTPPAVLSLKLSGVVDPFVASYIERGIDRANGEGDAAVLITIDTPGGLDSSMRSIIKSILASKIPVICYTAPSGARAASAGTFIMLSCPVAAMAPGTNIGAAHPVGVAGAIEQDKVTNDAAAFIRSLADRWHRNADWAEDAVRTSISASEEDALSLHVVDLVAPTPQQLLARVGGCANGLVTRPTTGLLASQDGGVPGLCPQARIVPFGMSLGENLFHALADPNVAFLLLNIGFLALIAWIFHPGFHVSLAVGVISVTLALAILETLPVELVGFVLLMVSAVLFVLDVKAQAHGVLTAGGIGTLILGGLLLFNPSVPSARVSRPLIVLVAVGAGLFTFFALRALFAAKGKPVVTGREALEGTVGVALSDIDPRGIVRARGETWSAEAASGPIPSGATVRVVRVRGVNLVVDSEKELAEHGAHGQSRSEGETE
jgi:membrane-bound serine protease (ClpP class)